MLIALEIILPIMVFNFLCFFLIAKVNFSTSVIISLARSIGSYLYYPFLFPVSDQSLYYWPEVLKCENNDILLNFYSLADLLHCYFGVNTLQIVNIFYGLIGSIALCFCFRSLKYAPRLLSSLHLNPKNNLWPYSLVVLIVSCDPVSIFFTTAFGKDLVTYFFVLSFMTFIFSARRFLSPVFLILVLTSTSVFSERLYATAILFLSMFLAQFLPKFSLAPAFPFLHFRIRLSLKTSWLNLFLKVLTLCLVLFSMLYATVVYLSSVSASDLFLQYSSDMGGTLFVPNFTPIFLRPIAFWFLPLPFYPLSLASVPIGFSTIVISLLVSKIFSMRFQSAGLNPLSMGLSLLLLVTLMFGFSMTNFGISARYRCQYFMPVFAVLLLTARNSPVVAGRKAI